MSPFQFGNVVVVDGQIGVIVKSWANGEHDVYVRSHNGILTYHYSHISHYIYGKELTDKDLNKDTNPESDCVSGHQVDPHVNCSEYDQLTERDWVDYEFATIAYDYGIHPKAVDQIGKLLDRLVKSDGS